MEKNETQLYDSINQITNSFIKLKCEKSRNETMRKYNFSRNSFLNNKTSLSINSFKSYLISNTNSEDISNKNEVLFKSDINSNSKRKTSFINANKFNKIFLRKIKSKKNQKNFIGTKSLDIKNNNIIQLLNKSQNNNRKIDFIKYKFLLGQKNYYKSFLQHDNFNFSSYYSKKINPYVSKNPKIFYIDIDKLNKLFLGKDKKNIYSIKDLGDNLFISLSKHFNNNQNRKNVSKINNCINIKIKNYNSINTLKFPNESLFEDKNIIRSKNNNIIEKSIKNKNIKNQQIHFKQEDNNKPKNNNDIIDDNYKEYLKDITSAESNKSKSERKNINKQNPKLMIKNLKQIKFEIPLNDKNEIFQYKKRLNKYNYSNMLIKNNKKLFEFKKFVTNRKKSLDDINRSISKSITIENLVFGKKIMLDKSTNK